MPFPLTISYILIWGIPFILARLHKDRGAAMSPLLGFGSRMGWLAFGAAGPVHRLIFTVLL